MTVLGKNVLPEAKLGTLPFWRQYLRGFSQCAFQANEITASAGLVKPSTLASTSITAENCT